MQTTQIVEQAITTGLYSGKDEISEGCFEVIKGSNNIETVLASEYLKKCKERFGNDIHLHIYINQFSIFEGAFCKIRKELPNGDPDSEADGNVIAVKAFNKNRILSYEILDRYRRKDGI